MSRKKIDFKAGDIIRSIEYGFRAMVLEEAEKNCLFRSSCHDCENGGMKIPVLFLDERVRGRQVVDFDKIHKYYACYKYYKKEGKK